MPLTLQDVQTNPRKVMEFLNRLEATGGGGGTDFDGTIALSQLTAGDATDNQVVTFDAETGLWAAEDSAAGLVGARGPRGPIGPRGQAGSINVVLLDDEDAYDALVSENALLPNVIYLW